MKKTLFLMTLSVAVILALHSCETQHQFRKNYRILNSFLRDTENQPQKPYLKAHLTNGDVVILQDNWEIDTLAEELGGTGKRFNYNRRLVNVGPQKIPLDQIIVFETNEKLEGTESGRIAALGILFGVEAAFGIYCIINPKACFGSCPTFYINNDDNFHYADAEGFTNAILPSMEYGDVDALDKHFVPGSNFSLYMKNEALETHCIREIKLLAYPLKNEERVYHTPEDEFFLCNAIYPLTKAIANEGEITFLVNKPDKIERFSLADPNNMNSKEEIYLEFNSNEYLENPGFILHFRQTLMTTYLFYSAIGYMGDLASDYYAKMETDPDVRKSYFELGNILGGIDIHLWNEEKSSWELQGSFTETGPIAINRQMIPLKHVVSGSTIKIKIMANKGLWRLEYAALANILTQVNPTKIQPSFVFSDGLNDIGSLNAITDPEKLLISMPGSSYKINFTFSETGDYELFLYAKGYYLEWMRENWLREKDLRKLRMMVNRPEVYLKKEARLFKRYEETMELQFWNSRIQQKEVSCNFNNRN